MELNEYKQIKNRRYSPKEVLAHFIISNGDVVNKEFNSMVSSLENTFSLESNLTNSAHFYYIGTYR